MGFAQITSVDALMIEKQRKGFASLSLSNFALTTEPEVCAGSVVEIGGALYDCDANASGTGWAGIANSTQVYFLLHVTGVNVTWYYSTTAPVWSLSKQGWYGTGGSALDRAIGGCYKDAGGDYTWKWLYEEHDQVGIVKRYGDGSSISGGLDAGGVYLKKKVLAIGDWNMDIIGSIDVAHGVTQSKIRSIDVIIRADDDSVGTQLLNLRTGGDWLFSNSGHSLANVVLTRVFAGTFDASAFDKTSYNRGWITIEYEA